MFYGNQEELSYNIMSGHLPYTNKNAMVVFVTECDYTSSMFFATGEQEIYLGKSVHKSHNLFNKSKEKVHL